MFNYDNYYIYIYYYQLAPIPDTAKVIEKALDDAEQLISKDKVAQNIFITDKELEEAIQTIKGAVMIAYPMGIPSFDPVQEIIDDNEDLSGSAVNIIIYI